MEFMLSSAGVMACGALSGVFASVALMPGNRVARFVFPAIAAVAYLLLDFIWLPGALAVVIAVLFGSALLSSHLPISWTPEMRVIRNESDLNVFINESGRAIVDFYAHSCTPCRALASTLNGLAIGGKRIAVVNIETSQDLAAKYEVQAVPTILVIEHGKVVGRLLGMHTKRGLAKLLS
jgi:thioredoxin 1